MPVIGHQAKPQEPAGKQLQPFVEDIEKGLVIARLVEDAHAAIGPVEDVVDYATGADSSGATHDWEG